MYISKLKLLILMLWALNVPLSIAQTSNGALTLEQSLAMALKNNSSIKKSIAEEKEAKGENLQAMAGFLPSVELSSGYNKSNDPLYAFGFKLQQQIVTQADFNPALLNNPGSTEQFSTQVLIQQPLFNPDAIAGKSAIGNKVKAMKLMKSYTIDNIELAVKKTYYGIQLAQKQLNVLAKAQLTAAAYLKTAEDNFEQGYLKEADLLAVNVRINELVAQQAETRSQIESLSEMLNFLMGRAIQTPVTLADSLKQVIPQLTPITTTSGRADVLAMQYNMKARKQMQKSALLAFAPRINAFGSYNIYDKELGGTAADSWLLGVKLQWNIFSGGKNLGKHISATAVAQKATTEYHEYLTQKNMQLTKAFRTITVAQNNVSTYELTAQQAEESLRIRLNRFKQGMERATDVLMAETKAAESQLRHLNAIYSYNMAVFEYEMLSKSN